METAGHGIGSPADRGEIVALEKARGGFEREPIAGDDGVECVRNAAWHQSEEQDATESDGQGASPSWTAWDRKSRSASNSLLPRS